MKLIYDLSKKDEQAAARHLNGEKVLCCTPYDIDASGKYTHGWLIVTKGRFLCMEDGMLTGIYAIAEGSDYKTVTLTNSGFLEFCTGNESKRVIQYSMSHVPRYISVAKILNQLHAGEEPKVVSDDQENQCPKCGRVYAEDTGICYACTNKMAILRRLGSVVRPYWQLMAMAIILFWALAAIRLVIPVIYRELIDGYLTSHRKELAGIILLVGAIAASNLATALLTIIRSRVMVKVGSYLSRDLRAMVYAKIQALSINYLDARKPGDLMNRVTGDTEKLQRFVQDQAAMGISEVISLIAVSIILFASNWKLALLIILPAPLVLVLCRLIWRKIRSAYHRQSRIWDGANSMLQDILSGIRVVKAFGQEEKEIRRFTGISRELADITGKNEKLWNTLFPSLGFVMGVGNFLVLLYGGQLVMGHRMQIGELVQFSQYAAIIYGPLNWLSFIPRWLAEAMTSAERIFEVIDEEPDVKDQKNSISHKIKGQVTFENVSFGYQAHQPVLENIRLDVAPGEMIGLVGHSGAGKSTLINLVMRFYDVNEGHILIDGFNIKDIRQQDLRSQIGVVLQETFLFSGTVLENICYAKPDAPLDEVIRAAKIANAHDFIMKFPDAYDTKVGERGQRLSGGERQRIAIARAILHDPKILILDEATSSVDTETEQQIQEALGRLVKNRTTFAIAHRLSTLKNANRLLVIDQGKQAELGTHDELMKKKGIYYGLVMAQRQMSRIRGVDG